MRTRTITHYRVTYTSDGHRGEYTADFDAVVFQGNDTPTIGIDPVAEADEVVRARHPFGRGYKVLSVTPLYSSTEVIG